MVRIIGIGGGYSPGSSTEVALEVAMNAAACLGAETKLYGGDALMRLPHYGASRGDHGLAAELVADVRSSDGLIIASPGYHGTISGLVKNALDYLEETAHDPRPYLSDLPVGLIATAHGWQAAGSTLFALRSVAHALRGWPTPLGAALRSTKDVFSDGNCVDEAAIAQLSMVASQVFGFAARLSASSAYPAAAAAKPNA